MKSLLALRLNDLWHRRRSGRLSFQKPCSIPFGPIPQLAATDLLIAGAAEPPAVGVHPGWPPAASCNSLGFANTAPILC